MNRAAIKKLTFYIVLAVAAGASLMPLIIDKVETAHRSSPPTDNSPYQTLQPIELKTRRQLLLLNHRPADRYTTRSPRMAALSNKHQFFREHHSIPAHLEELLRLHYDDTQLIFERRAYRRVWRWKDTVDRISDSYDRISTETMLAVIKEETQGRTGSQISKQKAIGLTQIKYQGAWSFIWNALFKESVEIDGKMGPDYFNQSIRQRYPMQLDRIKQHLIDNQILCLPTEDDPDDFRWARSKTWENLKVYLNQKYETHEYQIAIDIAAMYLDHLTFLLNDFSAKATTIKHYFDGHDMDDMDQAHFQGSTQAMWTRLKQALQSDCIHIYRETNRFHLKEHRNKGDKTRLWLKIKQDIRHRLEINLTALLKQRLAVIIARTNDPKTCYAAYHTGPTRILNYIETARPMPSSAMRYAQNVERHRYIFDDWAASQKVMTQKKERNTSDKRI